LVSKAVEVCIVGAGPVGATLALRLAHAGVSVAVVDAAPLPPMEHPHFDGRAYAIAAGSRALLQAAGAWDALPIPPCPILDIRVSDGAVGRKASPLHLHFSHREAGSGAFGWMVEARSLRVALNARLAAEPGAQLFAPARAAVTRDAGGARVQVEGGPELACRLVVAAEGRESPLRRAAGIGVTRIPYKQRGLVCAIAHERPHRNVALEHFLPGGPFAQLPLGATSGAPNVSAIVWTDRAGLAERLHALPPDPFAREIARRLGDHLGAVRPIGRRWLYPLAAMHAGRYVDTRLALVGDAAHAIHPIAGQGLNLGFRDVIALADRVLETLEHGGDPGSPSVLAAYQRARRPDSLAMLAATDALDRLFSTSNPALRLARDVGIAAVDRAPGLKRFFMRRAMGL
jgi:2-octaprenyl-6-methoxyphenol hydroxylase